MLSRKIAILFTFLSFSGPIIKGQEQDPMTMHGGSVLAMAGKDSVALVVDKRFASGNHMVNVAPRQVFVPSPHLMVAFTGLEGDVQSLKQDLSRQVDSKLGRGLGFLNENRQQRAVVSPRAMASLTSHVLYNRRQSPYYVEPLVVGLTEKRIPKSSKDGEKGTQLESEATPPKCFIPFLCSMDCIGAKSVSNAFVCAGAASNSIFGTAEALWKPELTQEELVEVCSTAFLSALERDCLSGYGAVLYLITPKGITEWDLASRND